MQGMVVNKCYMLVNFSSKENLCSATQLGAGYVTLSYQSKLSGLLLMGDITIELRLSDTNVLSLQALHLWHSLVVGIFSLLCAIVHLMCSAIMLGQWASFSLYSTFGSAFAQLFSTVFFLFSLQVFGSAFGSIKSPFFFL
jgi:hypothetical protein